MCRGHSALLADDRVRASPDLFHFTGKIMITITPEMFFNTFLHSFQAGLFPQLTKAGTAARVTAVATTIVHAAKNFFTASGPSNV
jgi:hypothetical protein